MPTFEDPAADATEAEQALRGLAHATRRIEDPTQIYAVLGSVSHAIASLNQALHQIGSFHDEHGARTDATIIDPRQTGAAYRTSWDLHRAAEMLNSVGKSIDSAHASEATIVYQPRHLAAPGRGHTANGVSL